MSLWRSATSRVRVGRDVKSGHGDLSALHEARRRDRVADGRVVFPYDEVRIDFVLRAAAYARRRRYGNDPSAARVAASKESYTAPRASSRGTLWPSRKGRPFLCTSHALATSGAKAGSCREMVGVRGFEPLNLCYTVKTHETRCNTGSGVKRGICAQCRLH